jgi:hypothetical protein
MTTTLLIRRTFWRMSYGAINKASFGLSKECDLAYVHSDSDPVNTNSGKRGKNADKDEHETFFCPRQNPIPSWGGMET